jgi:Na+-translocating ferredoxin:NAD+ oxidoreductase RnfG subunit
MSRPGANWFTILPAAAVALAPGAASATVYLTIQAAQQAMFPAGRFIDHPLALSDDQRKVIARAAGAPGYDKVQRVWEVRAGDRRVGWFMVDRVIGKHEYITYALALGADGSVRGIEILDYRETYGGEIRNPNWRRQFVGKRPGSDLRLDRDIKNISGATLSSRHVTDGVRRLLVTYQMLLANA